MDGCSQINQIESFDTYDSQPILILQSGNCTLSAKALNAQAAGAKMLLVYDTKSDILNNFALEADKSRI